jgi:hypothetical protein
MNNPQNEYRERVWQLIREHPELSKTLALGNLVARHRHWYRHPEDSDRYWRTDWAAIRAILEAALAEEAE